MKRFFKPAQIAWSAQGQSHGLAHGVVFKRLLISGQPGVDSTGEAPADLEAQIGLAFDNLLVVVEAGQMEARDLVKIAAYIAAPGSFALYEQVRKRKLDVASLVSTYVEVAGLADPRWRVLIEGEAVSEAA
ncbi:MAG TPA: RidA family protein [Roseiarcus sp.]|nr:RidA family protein [Roseiarcus sp.]